MGVYAFGVSSQIREAQPEVLDEQLAAELMVILDGVPVLEDPAELEQLAVTFLMALEQPEMPAEFACAVLEAIRARGDENAAGVRAALGVLGAEPLAAHARAGVQRLAGEAIVSSAAAGVGTLAVTEAVRIQSAGAELLVVLLARPGAGEVQVAIVGIEHHDSGGALLVECGLMAPAPIGEARELLGGVDGAAAPQPVAPQELTARVRAAARRAVAAQIALSYEAGPALVIISLALTGDPTGLPRPAVLPPWEDDDPGLIVDAAQDEDGFHEVMEMLLEEFEQHAKAAHPPGGVVCQQAGFVASSMLGWKGGYDDGRLGRWTRADLGEFLLGYFPRKVMVEEETLTAVPECVRAFLGFLDVHGSLSGDPIERLEAACEQLRDEFLKRARDSTQWGLAKSMVMSMQGEGIDPGTPGALDSWMSDFNARPREQRDAIIGPAADRMLQAAGPGPGSEPRASKQREQRKAQRAARKRNRRP